jgi:hypothetical protein
MKSTRIFVGALFLQLAPFAAATPTLWYAQPAAKWDEALPVGSGRLGAMVFGGTAEERIQFNEDTLWLGKPHNYVRAGSADIVPQVRQLLADGQVKEAQDLARAKMLSDPVRQKAYQPFGDLRLTSPVTPPRSTTVASSTSIPPSPAPATKSAASPTPARSSPATPIRSSPSV